MSMGVLVVVVILSFCTIMCLLSEKRSLQHALDDVREELDKVRAALERQEKESHHNTHKWLNSNHTGTVEAPTRTKNWMGCSTQPVDASGQLISQDLLSSTHSCPSTVEKHQLHPSSMDDCSFYPSGGLEELPPVSSPTMPAADGSLTSWPQQRWREEGKVGLSVV